MTRRLTDPDFIDEIRRLKERLAVLERGGLPSGEGFPNYKPGVPSLYADELRGELYFFDGIRWKQIVYFNDDLVPE